jgi:hypothetical protein
MEASLLSCGCHGGYMTSIEPVLRPFRAKLNTQQAADYLGLGKSTLDKLRVTGGGPVHAKVLNRVIYDVADLDTWLSRHKRLSTSETAPQAPAGA